jgi:hypothetical protein
VLDKSNKDSFPAMKDNELDGITGYSFDDIKAPAFDKRRVQFTDKWQRKSVEKYWGRKRENQYYGNVIESIEGWTTAAHNVLGPLRQKRETEDKNAMFTMTDATLSKMPLLPHHFQRSHWDALVKIVDKNLNVDTRALETQVGRLWNSSNEAYKSQSVLLKEKKARVEKEKRKEEALVKEIAAKKKKKQIVESSDESDTGEERDNANEGKGDLEFVIEEQEMNKSFSFDELCKRLKNTDMYDKIKTTLKGINNERFRARIKEAESCAISFINSIETRDDKKKQLCAVAKCWKHIYGLPFSRNDRVWNCPACNRAAGLFDQLGVKFVNPCNHVKKFTFDQLLEHLRTSHDKDEWQGSIIKFLETLYSGTRMILNENTMKWSITYSKSKMGVNKNFRWLCLFLVKPLLLHRGGFA